MPIGVDVGPFDNILEASDVVAALDGYDKTDRNGTPAFPGTTKVFYARYHNRLVGAIADIVEWVNGTDTTLTSLDGRIDVLEALSIGTRLTALEADDTSVAAAIAALQAADTTFDSRIDAYDALNVGARLTSLEDFDVTIDARVDALEASPASPYIIDVTKAPYNAVADGSVSGTSTDNYTAFSSALAACAANPGYELLVPPGQYDVYFDSDIFDTTPGKHTYLNVGIPGLRIRGAGVDKTIIRGKSVKTAVGRVASLVGNTLTLQTASDATKVRSTDSIRIALNPDGSGARTIAAGTISVEGPVTASANGNGGTGEVPIRNDGDRFQGVQVGDYVFADKAFALFRHDYTTAALTTPFDLTFRDLTLDCEVYGAVVDPTGDANPILDCPTYQFDSNPQPMGAGTSPYHRVLFERVKLTRGYTQIHMGAGGNLTYADVDLVLNYCDVAKDAMSGVYFGSNDGFSGRTYKASNSFFHDVHATQGSHLNYVNSAANIDIQSCQYEGWRSSNFALQHWGGTGATNYPRHARFVNTLFGSGGGAAVLTNEHGSMGFANCSFESASGVLVRCSTSFVGCLFQPIAGNGGNNSIATYLDCQHLAQIDIVACGWNLRNVVGVGYAACLSVESPVQISLSRCWASSYDTQQDSLNTLVRGNTGPFLNVQAGSTGGQVFIDGLRGKFATQSGAPTNIGWLASLTGTTGAAVSFNRVRYLSRPAVDRGMIQCQNRTSTDRIEVNDCDLTAASGVTIYTTSSLPADVISGRANRFNGIGSTFVNRQRLRTREEIGADITSAATVTIDQDFNCFRFTGTTPVATMNLTGTSQLGYDGAPFDALVPENWSTLTSGNIAVAYVAPAGGARVRFTYDAVAAKWTCEQAGQYAQKTHAAFAGSALKRFTAAVQTTGTTPTTLATIALADNTTYRLEAEVTLRDEAGTHRGVLGVVACVYRQGGGGATQEGATTDIHAAIRSDAGLALTVAVSGNNALVQVTGLSATTIDWVGAIVTQGVATAA